MWCMEWDGETCLNAEEVLEIDISTCTWEDTLQAYFRGFCGTSGAITYSTYSDDQCTEDETAIASSHMWADMDYCNSVIQPVLHNRVE